MLLLWQSHKQAAVATVSSSLSAHICERGSGHPTALSRFCEQNDSASVDSSTAHSAVPSAAKTGLVQSQQKPKTGTAGVCEAHCVGAASQKPSVTGNLLKIVETTTENRLYHDFHGFSDGGWGSASSVTVSHIHAVILECFNAQSNKDKRACTCQRTCRQDI